MSKAELDELNRISKEWRERHTASQPVPDAVPEQSEQAMGTPELRVGEQMELL
jgi:hypothetical protein